MNPIGDALLQAGRLVVLRSLSVAPSYRLPLSVIIAALDGVGISLTAARAETLCAWLEERDLVTLSGQAITLTDSGQDVVAGRKVVDGVRRPSPADIMAAAASGLRGFAGGA